MRLLRGQTNFYEARHTSGTSTLRHSSVMTAIPRTQNVITVPRASKGCNRSLSNPATGPCTRVNAKWRNGRRNTERHNSFVRARRTTDRGTNTADERIRRVPYSLASSPLPSICVGYLSLSPGPRKGEEKKHYPCRPLIVFTRATFSTDVDVCRFVLPCRNDKYCLLEIDFINFLKLKLQLR